MTEPLLPQWLAFHFHYHEQQDQLLEDFLRPLVVTLTQRGETDSFFFVRYALGGPHVRLRIRLCGDNDFLAKEVQDTATRFFDGCPSHATLHEREILAINRDVLKNDPSEMDGAVYPDNFVRQAPYNPEFERYGGKSLFPQSLAFFAVSSCRVLDWLHYKRGEPVNRLSFAFYLLALQALGFSRNWQELIELLHYPVPVWDAAPPLLVQRGDEAFERHKDRHVQSLRHQIETIVNGNRFSQDLLAERALEGSLRDLGSRLGILSSHLHMTANRLGLKNAEEIYLARLLWRTFNELATVEPMLLAHLEPILAEKCLSTSLENLVSLAIKELERVSK